ncbi:serine protease snake-like [Pieris brassicae]|uniref:serine protease snake-like n=1 Tax=Pieris brassicae TaxID=7116 RepID=UPI001E661F97|nr:serine protease snake-like [Pieris brassicae]
MLIHLAIVFSLLACAKSLSEGDSCAIMDGSPGVCKAINDCSYAEDDFRKHLKPMKCGHSEFDPFICCDSPSESPLGVTTPKIRGRKTTETDQLKGKEFSLECDKAERRGQKAYDKCLEYQEKYVYPCRPGPTGNIRVDDCTWKPEQLIIGGVDAYKGEFPHMALLGYGNDKLEWLCGGVIISERYVLTAGHCTYSAYKHSPVKKIRVGILKRSDAVDSSKEYNVVPIKYPEYHSPLRYNDIALLQTDRDIELNKYVVPACLHDGGADIFKNSAIVTGWGTTVYKSRDFSDVLQKARVERFESVECEKKYNHIRLMPNGFNSTTQLCYGDRFSNRDTCEGDSGGPLQKIHPTIRCMYSVIGITSMGKSCGIAGEPSIYTRVEYYLPWIEEIVWP